MHTHIFVHTECKTEARYVKGTSSNTDKDIKSASVLYVSTTIIIQIFSTDIFVVCRTKLLYNTLL
jgi:hypothetical protein